MPPPADDRPWSSSLAGDAVGEILHYLTEIASGHCSITPELIVAAEADERRAEILTSLLYLHQDLVYKEQLHSEALAELGGKNEALERGRAELERMNEELSTPLIKIGPGVIMAPLIGSVDDRRASGIMERVMAGVITWRARHVILDITGVPKIDSGTVSHFEHITQGVRLLGAQCILAGVRPQVAMAFADLDADLRNVAIFPDVENALTWCLQRVGR
jgi:anti-anti-sigma regulatory factor